MFEQSTLPGTPRRLWAVCMGFGAESLLVTGMVLAPLIWPQVIPRMAYVTALAAPGPPPGPPSKGNPVRVQHHGAPLRPFHEGGLVAPVAPPAHAILIVDPPPALGDFGVPGGGPAGVPGGIGISGGILGGLGPDLHPPAVERPPDPVRPPAAIAAAAIPRYKVGGLVHLAEPIFRPDPVYPPLARQMRVAGSVELVAVIGADGRIKELRLTRGHPLLARAALDAVARWIYSPTTLNGVPVEVEAPITVTFRMN